MGAIDLLADPFGAGFPGGSSSASSTVVGPARADFVVSSGAAGAGVPAWVVLAGAAIIAAGIYLAARG